MCMWRKPNLFYEFKYNRLKAKNPNKTLGRNPLTEQIHATHTLIMPPQKSSPSLLHIFTHTPNCITRDGTHIYVN